LDKNKTVGCPKSTKKGQCKNYCLIDIYMDVAI